MLNQVRSRAEEKFTKVKQQDKKLVKEREKEQQEVADKIARLRTLRLAKESADKEAADRTAAEKAAANKIKASAKSVRAARRKPATAKKPATDSDDSGVD